MTAFFFDEDHPDLEVFFGPQCASFIINAIEESSDIPPLRLLRGSLLHRRYCYGLAEVTLGTPHTIPSGIVSSTMGHLLTPNKDHLLTIICDLAETMNVSGSSMTEEEVQTTLARKNIWVVVAQGLSDEHRPIIEKTLCEFGPYLGWVKVDWSNPVHMDLFANSLFKDMFVDKNGLCILSEWPEETEDREDDEAMAKKYGSRSSPRLLNHQEFEQLSPKLLEMSEPSDRGKLTARRISGDASNHRTKVGWALSQENFKAVGDFQTFSTTRPENGIEFVVPEEKLTKYLLSLDHPHGRAKAQFFHDTLGIVSSDWRYLADQFCQAARNSEFYRLNVKEYGVMHGTLVLVTGRNGRQAVVETGWKLEENGPASFVTAYPGDESKIATLEPVPGRVPEPNLPEQDRWVKIHELAHNCGMQRGEAKSPTPMVLEKWGTIWEGACGFGWAFLPDARASFAKWALKSKIGYASHPGVHIRSKLSTQSIEKNLAYAEGYAEVLRANGIECLAESRLD